MTTNRAVRLRLPRTTTLAARLRARGVERLYVAGPGDSERAKDEMRNGGGHVRQVRRRRAETG